MLRSYLVRIFLFVVNWIVISFITLFNVVIIIFINICYSTRAQNNIELLYVNINKTIIEKKNSNFLLGQSKEQLNTFFSNTKLALGFATYDPSQTNSIFLWLQNNAKSNLALMLSFVFLFTSMTMLKMFSNTFFSMCMTSRLWQRRLVFQ